MYLHVLTGAYGITLPFVALFKHIRQERTQNYNPESSSDQNLTRSSQMSVFQVANGGSHGIGDNRCGSTPTTITTATSCTATAATAGTVTTALTADRRACQVMAPLTKNHAGQQTGLTNLASWPDALAGPRQNRWTRLDQASGLSR